MVVLCNNCGNRVPIRKERVSQRSRNWEIDRSDLEPLEVVGRGSFGEVWYGMWRETIEVAIKKVIPGAMSPEAFLREAAIMKTFDHPRIVSLYGVCTRSQPILIVTEYMEYGSLRAFLGTRIGKSLTLQDLCDIAYQIASGMDYIEEKGLVHRDLAARNVLVGEGLAVKISDFGLTRAVQNGEYLQYQSKTFPVKWTAPEGLTDGIFSIKSDVWSYGIVLMELFKYGQPPYSGMPNYTVTNKVLKGYRMPKPRNVPRRIYDLILDCWDEDPERRPCFAYLKSKFAKLVRIYQ